MTALIAVPIVVLGLAAITLCVVGILIAIVRQEAYTPKPPRHTPDCLDWRRRGQRDATCTAHHGTDWFLTESEHAK